ncbi:MAG TPA: hypothetical protein VFB07_11060 [Vicinamibacterales bacterium]|nr:hypothetical protein [Vicinamibacterales bacterium]
MRWTVLALVLVAGGANPAAQPPSISDLMVKTIYPASDAIFYIDTRTPSDAAAWRALERQTETLAAAAAELMQPGRARGRDQWTADARLLVDAAASALAAIRRHDVAALGALNDALYQSCVQCHQHYRPGYGQRRAAGGEAPPAALDGTWNFSTVTPLERPAEFAGRATMTDAEARAYAARVVDQRNVDRRPESRDADVAAAYNDAWYDRGVGVATVRGRHQTSLIVDPPDGRLPAQTPDAMQKAAARAAERRQHPADGPEDRSLGERCLSFNAGPPMMTGPYNNYVQIFQRENELVIFNEMIHDARVVPIDRTPQAHAPAAIRRWQGDSRAHWEGATLVVDTTNFTDKTSFRGTDEQLHLVERFTRIDAGTLLYEFTVDDPSAFTRPWTVSLPMTRSDDRVYEYACHEGNYALANILSGARDEERRRR